MKSSHKAFEIKMKYLPLLLAFSVSGPMSLQVTFQNDQLDAFKFEIEGSEEFNQQLADILSVTKEEGQ